MEATALSDLRHGVLGKSALVSKLSHDMTLLPGDVICCGTSAGVGTMKEKRNVIDVEIEGIGRLTNAFVQQRLLLSAERFGSAFVRDASDGWSEWCSKREVPRPPEPFRQPDGRSAQ